MEYECAKEESEQTSSGRLLLRVNITGFSSFEVFECSLQNYRGVSELLRHDKS